MEIIGETATGYILTASAREVKDILASVSRTVTDKNPIRVGDKIPAFDYVSKIKECKDWRESFAFKTFQLQIADATKIIETINSLMFK